MSVNPYPLDLANRESIVHTHKNTLRNCIIDNLVCMVSRRTNGAFLLHPNYLLNCYAGCRLKNTGNIAFNHTRNTNLLIAGQAPGSGRRYNNSM